MKRLRSHLLGSLAGAPPMHAEPTITNAVHSSVPEVRPDDMLAAYRRMVEETPRRRRGVGGSPLNGIAIEVDPTLWPGQFALREPGAAEPYTGPLPMVSLNVFYRDGDILRLSVETIAALPKRDSAPVLASGEQWGRS